MEQNKKVEEKGNAEIKVCLTCGEIKVYHSEGSLLFDKTAKKGDWDKIWNAIRN